MQTQQFSERLKQSIASSRNFRSALTRLREGKEATPRSWVYEQVKDPSQILNQWLKILHSNEEGDLKLISDWDEDAKSKFSPQGAVAPFSERQDTLSEYWAHLLSPQVFHSKEWQKAKAMAISLFGFNQTGEPKPVEEVVKSGLSDDKYNTSSGDPLFLKRKKPEAIRQALDAASNGSWSQFYPVLGSRASMGKTNENARWIFMFPMSVNLVEQSFQQPLQDYIRRKGVPFFTPWEGYDKVQEVLSDVDDTSLKFGCDYTKMDQHFNYFHALECEDVIKHYFRREFWGKLHDSIHYTFHCPVVAPDYLILGPHSMPSGSGWTNFLETVFNFILVCYFKIKYGLRISDRSMGIGDDQFWEILGFHGDKDKLAAFVVSVFKSVGLDANSEKQEVAYDMIAFLQRRSWTFWDPFGVKYAGVYRTVRALTSEIFPEFYHNEKEWTWRTFALRCLMILENCRYHPKFKEFCIFIAEGNDNIKRFVTSPDAEILLTRRLAKKIANFIPTYTQAAMEVPILTFQSLKVLRAYYKDKAA